MREQGWPGWWQVDCSGGCWKNPGKDGGALDHSGGSEDVESGNILHIFQIANDLVIE